MKEFTKRKDPKTKGQSNEQYGFRLKASEWLDGGNYRVKGTVKYDVFYDTKSFVEDGEVVHIQFSGLCEFELEGIECEPEWPGGPEEWDYIISDFNVLELHTIKCPSTIHISPELSLKKSVETLSAEIHVFLAMDGLTDYN